MTDLPTGTVTFLFTDIEGSPRLWEQHPEAMRQALAQHDALLRHTIEAHGGQVFKTIGDQFCAAFASATQAVVAAVETQRAFHAEVWEKPASLRVRMALNTGAVELRGGDYFGPPLNRVARLLAAGHGGQILLSHATSDLVQEALPPEMSLRDLGAHHLKDLRQPEHVFQLLAQDLPADFPPLRSLEAFTHNLPAQLTSFIGREEAMAQVKAFLATTRLLTLTGSGGCGKTRLALQVAADLLEDYAEGVWLVELAPLANPALVPQTVASALGVREEPGRPLTATLGDYLRPKSLLLVLDNCEHLLAACAQLAESLLRACPKLRILASSREGLGIGGEQTYRVPSLSLPDPKHLPPLARLRDFEAVQLFADRARLSQTSFAVTPANAPAVVQVCDRLDGIPLAIELAAARVKALPVEKLNERLDDMFRLLTGGSRTALPRQQTLRALIDWSYDLLSEEERALLRRLSAFVGGWTLEAAEAVCVGEGVEEWEVLDLLTSLVEKSLVLYEEREGEERYRLLETVRQYARDRLLAEGEAEAVRGRHRDWFLALAEEAAPELTGPRQGAWLDRLEEEHDNLRAALAWCMERSEAEAGLRLGGALYRFWQVRGYWAEGRKRLTEALALSGAEARTVGRARALNGAGALALCDGDFEAARTHWAECLAIRRELSDRHGIAGSLHNLGMVAQRQGDCAAARALGEEALRLNREVGNRAWEALNLLLLGRVAQAQEDYESARALCEESLAIHRELGGQMGIAHALGALGHVAREAGDYARCAAHYRESMALRQSRDDRFAIVQALEDFAVLAGLQRQWERAVRLLGAAQDAIQALGGNLPVALPIEYQRTVDGARAALGEEAFAAAWAAGRALSLDEAVALALEETSAG